MSPVSVDPVHPHLRAETPDLENRTRLPAGHTGDPTEATAAFTEKRPLVPSG
jgi:hypothetical protein